MKSEFTHFITIDFLAMPIVKELKHACFKFH